MAGRYKQNSNVAEHPNLKSAEEKQAQNAEALKERTIQLLPKSLNRAEKKVWMRVVPELIVAGRAKALFVDFIAEYCVVKVRLDALRVDLDKNEWVYETTGRHGAQQKSRPEVAQLNDDWRKWNSLVAQLGLSPATELRFNDRQGSLFDDDEFFDD